MFRPSVEIYRSLPDLPKLMSLRSGLKDALLRSDVQYIHDYLSAANFNYTYIGNLIANLQPHEQYDPSYELLDYMIQNVNVLELATYNSLLISNNMIKVNYIIDNSNIFNLKALLIETIKMYVNYWDKSVEIFSNVRAAFFMLLDHIDNKFTITNIVEIVQGVELVRSYVLGDILSYVIFRTVNDDIITNARQYELEYAVDIMLVVLLGSDAPNTLTEYILKYLPTTSRYQSEHVRNNLRRLEKPPNYHSLFSEDI